MLFAITLKNFERADFKTFKENVLCIFNKHAPMKIKCFQVNEAPFMTKELQKAIMKRSRLRKKFLKNKNKVNRYNYKVQRKYYKKLLKTTNKQYFNNLNTSKVTDKRTIWKTVALLFTNKPSGGEKKKFSRKVMKIIQMMLNYGKRLTRI